MTSIELANQYRTFGYEDPLHAAMSDYMDGSLTDLECLQFLIRWRLEGIT